MSHQIYDWNVIAQDFVDGNGALLIGNGASRAVNPNFEYRSLFKWAKDKSRMNADVQKLFTFFDTEDFELVLRLVWQTTNINQALGISDNKTRDAYLHVRNCLIEVVREIHPDYQEVAEQTISTIYSFIKQFRTVLSLNYDLILYWAVMYGRDRRDGHKVKDCFKEGSFIDNWSDWRKTNNSFANTTLVFYPHGNLMLCRDKIESEYKITIRREDNNLLQSILEQWKTENYVPLFVSEGTAAQKINAIKSSNYLNTVYREVLTDLGKKLVIYGWAISEQDQHILDRIKLSKPEKVAVSVYGNDQVYCNKVEQIIKDKFGVNTEIVFYKSDSSGCWKN
ncbi:MAG TPA: DUF4917 family protein [Arsenophonus nasoniae]|uniref:DUF4917 family protein n=1 Tax=Arsenophonus nasoniae TaxID=638 RepID=UPI00387918DA